VRVQCHDVIIITHSVSVFVASLLGVGLCYVAILLHTVCCNTLSDHLKTLFFDKSGSSYRDA
jgi:hypothetical protein